MRVGFVGAGTVGTALAVSLARSGYPIAAAASRTMASAEQLSHYVRSASDCSCTVFALPQQVVDVSDIVFVTTPDDAVCSVAASLCWRSQQGAVHCSGALSNRSVAAAVADSALVGCFHPLQAFASVDKAVLQIPGSTFGLEAVSPLIDDLISMCKAIGGVPLVLTAEQRVLYHLAGVLASNYVVTLVDAAAELWREIGCSQGDALAGLLPLLRGTVNNLTQNTPAAALTGPIARGDVKTVQAHLRALEARRPDLSSLYRTLGLQTLRLVQSAGRVDADTCRRMAAALAQQSRADQSPGQSSESSSALEASAKARR